MQSLKNTQRAYLFFLSMSWLGWGKAKQDLLLIIIKRFHSLSLLDFSPPQPISDCVSSLFNVFCSIYRNLLVYSNTCKVIVDPKNIFKSTFSLTMCAKQTLFTNFL